MAFERQDVYSRITDKIIASLEQGVRPWMKPWDADHLVFQRPLRHNGVPYQGINTVMLWYRAAVSGYSCPYWFTFNQVKEYGGNVKKGEHGEFIVFASKSTKTVTDSAGEDVEKSFSFLRGYTVFNGDQCENLPAKYSEKETIVYTAKQRHEASEVFFDKTGAKFTYGGNKAYYAPHQDFIRLPPFETFKDMESFVATKAHELIHWTGHESRLNRELSTRYGEEAYAIEELVAELGSAFLSADLNITPEIRDDHAAYLGHWLKALKNDKKLIIFAASRAQQAVTFLHGLQKTEKQESSEADEMNILEMEAA